MTQERWEKQKRIFSEAMEQEPSQREAYARNAAEGDPELVSELLRMLEESERESGLLSIPALASPRLPHPDDKPRFQAPAILARRFRIVRFIARGGMGEVYEAEDLELGDRVALKAIRLWVEPAAQALTLLKREVQLARRVTHPNVCRIFDFAQHEDSGESETTTLLSMELVEGETLAAYLRREGAMTWRAALPWIEQIGAGLQAIHDAGIIHGDLKPGNVMLARRAGSGPLRVVVMDFGMALPAVRDQPNEGVSLGGTPEYLAPEQAQGIPVTTAADVYSFALIVAEMVGVRRPLVSAKSDSRVLPQWIEVLQRCLELDPRRRLDRISRVVSLLQPSSGKRMAPWMAAGALCAATVAVVVVVVPRDQNQAPTDTSARRLFVEDDAIEVWSPSPDGRFLAGTAYPAGDLVLREVRTGGIQTVHLSAGANSSLGDARFSPDGKRLAFRSSGSSQSEIHVIQRDAAGDRTLYKSPGGFVRPLDWSQDGSRLLIAERPTEKGSSVDNLLIVSTADGSVLATHTLGKRGGRTLLGADGESLIFNSARTGPEDAFEIHSLSSNGAESTLIQTPGSDSLIAWSPSQAKLVFSSDRRGRPGLWAADVVDGAIRGEARELLPDATNIEPLGLTSGGSLFYRVNADANDVYTAVIDLVTRSTISPPVRVMDRFLGAYDYPNWSQDGRRLVFRSTRDPKRPAVIILKPETGEKRELPVHLKTFMRPQWVGNESSIIVQGAANDGQVGLFRINPADGGSVALVKSVAELGSRFEGVWSADGKIHFNRYTDWKRGIFRWNRETGEHRVLYVPPDGIDIISESLALSPDGRTLAFHARSRTAGTAALTLVPSDGGPLRQVMSIRQPESFLYGAFAWTPDSKRLLVARTRNNRESEIWIVPANGGDAARIGFPKGFRISALRLNPDGKRIAFYCWKWRSEIWVLESFLR